jgi:hypothetical protein
MEYLKKYSTFENIQSTNSEFKLQNKKILKLKTTY